MGAALLQVENVEEEIHVCGGDGGWVQYRIFVTTKVQGHSETNAVGCSFPLGIFFLLQRALLQDLVYIISPRSSPGLFWGSGLSLDLLHDWKSA